MHICTCMLAHNNSQPFWVLPKAVPLHAAAPQGTRPSVYLSHNLPVQVTSRDWGSVTPQVSYQSRDRPTPASTVPCGSLLVIPSSFEVSGAGEGVCPCKLSERSTPAPPGCPVWQAGGRMHRIHWVCALLIGTGWGCVLPWAGAALTAPGPRAANECLAANR
jgi:hypothetical protein